MALGLDCRLPPLHDVHEIAVHLVGVVGQLILSCRGVRAGVWWHASILACTERANVCMRVRLLEVAAWAIQRAAAVPCHFPVVLSRKRQQLHLGYSW